MVIACCMFHVQQKAIKLRALHQGLPWSATFAASNIIAWVLHMVEYMGHAGTRHPPVRELGTAVVRQRSASRPTTFTLSANRTWAQHIVKSGLPEHWAKQGQGPWRSRRTFPWCICPWMSEHCRPPLGMTQRANWRADHGAVAGKDWCSTPNYTLYR